MLYFISTTKGLIICSILYIICVFIPLLWLLKKMLQPEQIEIENGHIKEKNLTIFYNLALQNPFFVKLAILFLAFILIVSVIMFYGGLDVEHYEDFFKLFITICYILLVIQLVEERKTLFYAFLPIISVFVFFGRVFLGLVMLIGIILKKTLEFVMNVFFILPFKFIIKLLETK